MKTIRTILILLLTSSPFISLSQYYNIPGSVRTYGGSQAFGPWKWPVTWITATSDTTIQGKKCLGHFCQDGILVGDISGQYFTHEDSGVVYWYSEFSQDFSVLMDFNAGVGDSWRTYYNVNDTCGIEVVVDSVDMININGQNLKRLYVHYNDGWWTPVTIVERIGFMSNPYPGERMDFICNGTVADMEHYEGLRCYEDPNFGSHNFNSFACDLNTVGIDEISSLQKVDVYPNPCKDVINISFEKKDFINYQYQIFSVTGKLLDNGINSVNDPINTSSLNPGSYILTVYDGKEWNRSVFMKIND